MQKDSKRFSFFSPILSAISHFIRKPAITTTTPPHIRDHFDVKRMMILVVIALLPCIFVAIWNTGMQSFCVRK